MALASAGMTPRQRLLAVYTGHRPDTVPALADLSYWYAAHGGGKFIPGKTDGANRDKVAALLELHRRTGAAIHVNLGSFYRESFDSTVRVASGIRSVRGAAGDGGEYFHRFETPVGSVEEVRQWSDTTFSWPIIHPMVQGVEDLKVIRYVFERVRYAADWEALRQVDEQVGDIGLPLVQVPYSAMGFLMSRYAGVERTVMLAADEPDEFEQTIATINAAHATACRVMADGPAPVIIHSDNLTSDTHSPPWVKRYSAEHYRLMTRIAHENGKTLVTHIDGRLRGLLRTTAELGFDGADAVTPAPWGDLTPRECRDEAGPDYILSGGVPPGSFNPDVPLSTFDAQVEAWLELRHQSPALIIAPGDQLPPDGDIERVTRLVKMADAAGY